MLELPFRARTNGIEEHPDVQTAKVLSERAGIDLQINQETGLPPHDVDSCRDRIEKSLTWQAGSRMAHKHKTFLPGGGRMTEGSLAVSGQLGEIGRSTYLNKIREAGFESADLEGDLTRWLLSRAPTVLRPEHLEPVGDMVRAACAQAGRYELEGSRALDFVYLFERTRRWAAASNASKPGILFTPFLNPDYIRAAFSFPNEDATHNPFHRHIIAANVPEWIDVPFVSSRTDHVRLSSTPGAPEDRPAWLGVRGMHSYDTTRYWEAVGLPLIDEALQQGGFWTEVFDPDPVRTGWREVADELTMLYLLPGILERTLADDCDPGQRG